VCCVGNLSENISKMANGTAEWNKWIFLECQSGIGFFNPLKALAIFLIRSSYRMGEI
jgi:hypothetical protein